MRSTHNKLRKNYRILKEFQSSFKNKRMEAIQLSTAGFSFDLVTSTYTTKQGKTYYFVYDLGYLKLDHRQLIIVTKESYL
jgi:hypothetical protein